MYLKKIICQNIGPIEKINIDFPFDNNIPKSLIIVGENGSGKSILLSYLVDSMYEIGANAFQNIVKNDGMGHYYYKLNQNIEINLKHKYMSAYIQYSENDTNLEYLTKLGKKEFDEWAKENEIITNLKWNEVNDNDKYVTNDKNSCLKLFNGNICCYFPPDRYSKPFWLSNNYFNTDENNSKIRMLLPQKFNNYLYNPITVTNNAQDNLEWLMNILFDSKIDLDIAVYLNSNKQQQTVYKIPNYINQNNFSLLKIARQNIETILSKIFKQQVFLRTNYRGSSLERIYLVNRQNEIILNSLNSLSTGQMALFNMFLSIIRYADSNDLNNSIKLDQIKGIVIIDEVELHLHSDLQYNVLPELFKLFPKVQFIITTHSPLFILGMNKKYGDAKIEIHELPNNEIIQSEEFSQFLLAYGMMSDTKKYRQELCAIKDSINEKPLIITEGPSDWIHIKNALQVLKNDTKISEENNKILNAIDVDFLEYYPSSFSENTNNKYKLEMGSNALVQLCEQMSKIPQKRKLIFIADNDKKDVSKKLNDASQEYKNWGNNVYSFCIPKPKNRVFSDVCIEHYYSDSVLKKYYKCDDGIERRLFLGSEFDENGINLETNIRCENPGLCGKEKHTIIDGSQNKRVFINNLSLLNDENKITETTNLALSKINFAKAVAKKNGNFRNVRNFLLIVKIIHKILGN